jgi:WD40 repeat protein
MGVAFVPGETAAAPVRLLVSGSHDGTVRLWDTGTWQEKTQWQGDWEEYRNVTALAVSPDGQRLATGHINGRVILWELPTGTELASPPGHLAWVYTVAFSPDGRTLATGGGDHVVRLWDGVTGMARAVLPQQPREVKCVTFAPEAQMLVSVCRDGSVWIWGE